MKPEPKPEEGTWRAVAVWLTPPFLARLEAIAQEIGTHPGALLNEKRRWRDCESGSNRGEGRRRTCRASVRNTGPPGSREHGQSWKQWKGGSENERREDSPHAPAV